LNVDIDYCFLYLIGETNPAFDEYSIKNEQQPPPVLRSTLKQSSNNAQRTTSVR
jgi:hypothetical protein